MKEETEREEVGLEQLVGHWVLDSSLSTVRFAERTLWGLIPVKGRFTSFSGSGTVEPGGNVAGSVTVEARSLDTQNKKRDEHLRSSDFFDVERHPRITVEVSAVVVRGDLADVHAALAIKGLCEPIALVAGVEEVTADAIRLKAEVKVDRERFGMTLKKGGMTGHSTISVDAVFRRSAEETQ